MSKRVDVHVQKLLSSSWDFVRQRPGLMGRIGLLFLIPTLIQAIFVTPKADLKREDFVNVSGSELIENILGVSVAEFGLIVLFWLLVSLVYNSIVYGGVISTLLDRVKVKKLNLKRKSDASLSDIISLGFDHFKNVLVASLVVGAVIGVGFLLLVIPGIVAAFLLSFTIFRVVDKKEDWAEAMRGSFEMVKTNALAVLRAFLVLMLVLVIASIVAGIIMEPFSGRGLRIVNSLWTAATSAFGVVYASKLYLALLGKKTY